MLKRGCIVGCSGLQLTRSLHDVMYAQVSQAWERKRCSVAHDFDQERRCRQFALSLHAPTSTSDQATPAGLLMY